VVITGVSGALVLAASVTAAQAWPGHRPAPRSDQVSLSASTTTATASSPAPSEPSDPVTTAASTSSSTISTSTTTAATKAVATAAGADPKNGVLANLFEWNWPSVATECTTVLGPDGYGGVQVAPPQDSRKLSGTTHAWWDVYQPAGYDLNSRMGDEAAFKAMVKTCNAAGVQVIVDTVINHMTGGAGTSYSGNTFTAYNFPGLYTTDDFHHQGVECPTASGDVEDFDNAIQDHFCELSSLEDLKTESTYVRGQITGYLNKLLADGVSGFRVDAAKHIPHADLKAIFAGLNTTSDGSAPYIALEDFGGTGELAPAALTDLGSVLGLDASVKIKNAFNGNIAALKNLSDGLVPSASSLTFVQNHDTERNGDSLSYKDSATRLATQFVLGYDYGRPQVYSSFEWNDKEDSPPADANGLVTATNCGNGSWTCLDRDQGVLAMVAFHNSVGSAAMTNWWDDGASLISFSRGTAGWTALNNGTSAVTRSFQTGLATGTYCDLITGSLSGPGADGSCAGTTLTVNGYGWADVTVPAHGIVAITKDAKL
jgi:alpha-amylase